jgi:hypothetical protein
VLEHAACDQVVDEHVDGGHVLLQGGGRQAVGLGRFQVITHVEGADVLHALQARRFTRFPALWLREHR